jgi:gamma-glutamyltranspeptidase/glutathione hydrolase
MTEVAIASSSQLAANAGAATARAGGNAVDAAVAACLTAMTTEPGVCSLGGSGYVTIWGNRDTAVTIDGYAEMPGRGLPADRMGQSALRIWVDYGGGMETIVGFGSVAVPGGIAAMGTACERYGRLPWSEVVEPARAIAAAGFPMPSNCHYYLTRAAQAVYGWLPHSRDAMFADAGSLVDVGRNMRVPGLADSLARIARHGPEEFYTGELGRRQADYVSDNGGMLTRADMAAYRAVERASLLVRMDDWQIATSPPPAIGGAALTAMLLLMREVRHDGWTASCVKRLVETQRAVVDYRRRRLQDSADLDADVAELLETARGGLMPGASSATVHTSAVDAAGVGCAVTMSAGYGSGVLPPDTGIWLNNSLGEVELTGGTLKVTEPGTRLSSNMAPTVAHRTDGTVLSIGSPGADRITTAILQVLVNYMHFGMPLADAVAHARAHVESFPEGYRVAHEPGLPMDQVELPQRPFDHLSMFFGGVAAAEWSPSAGFTVAGDPRRSGGTAIVGQG